MIPREHLRKLRRDQILKILNERPKSFTEIVKEASLPDMTIDRELKQLLKEKVITKIIINNKPVYTLTKRGYNDYEKLWQIESIIREIKSFNSGSLLTYWKPYGIEYSIIQDTRFLSKNKLAHLIYGQNPEYFEKEDNNPQSLADEISKYVRDWIISYANDKGLKSSDFQDGHLILTYAFDFKKMTEYLKQFEINDIRKQKEVKS